MKLPGWSYKEKVSEIFREMAGDRAASIIALFNPKIYEILKEALAEEHPAEVAQQIAIHLTDGNKEAAFIAALILFPERFTQDEIRKGIQQFLIHVPNHLVAAAKLAGWPVEDMFDLGALDGPEDD